ncbi:MAG: undecaprenyl-diphosphatase UppP [Candidatus Doudnabacteria bacterium RIFCSPHIGHO2_02_FULL_48_21]|uniref:Undecaprenyl-diphosphatase n=1 Tax=Candidatus Doudnabacteria bacterium RIFCSPLOWO2_02_FULL_48_13 TaxID=1817845 RepID=A0A1F5Q9H9_9BACT|nr:MAG: undecaprenyl-diphosphatase UppP [Candidatus Doudnabacteria bacterium RIFCSPHIGHO2_01_48_18]OGE79497.1 MAG: undecaprenyl-diphosphatase UppP [Candidatus Doudnabacteria bacterium RIFCSPHIGHO2_01_FULL_48_180]OGE91330.1 MAG: undecaprenyl-diphosphatase UppP [Candidatus Doudnabacteria bacterium RIFCSPHIGHO2_12_FULL_47_25]OGE92875.1 MAG: undecaprenyl-diphosphatase UppP [Candidatus Doudnabacteria bacterium RIFCSPHIGHO2_02_FULL_48_21]OGE96661.1 MAG: undecaprenyl-diphosphatase UppP [Candidatus Dou
MEIFQAIVLGIIQGLTEFLPISSSAHLFLVPYFFGWDYQGIGFDIALHWGSLLAVLIFFGKDYLRYAKAIFVPGHRDRKLAMFLALGTVPAAVLGYFFADVIEYKLRHPLVTVATLAVFGVLLFIADRSGRKDAHIHDLNWKNTLFIGFAQAIALIPGVSRSGATITAGLVSHLKREKAAKFSFLLSGPVIFGAGLVVFQDIERITAPFAAGFISSAVFGMIAIKLLLRFISQRSFAVFTWYRIILAMVVLIVFFLRG